MNPSALTALLPWLLPPACGAFAGYVFGRLVLSRLVPSLIARSRPSLDGPAALRVDELSSWVLAVPLARIVPEEGSPAALSLERTIADFLTQILGSRGTIYAVRDAVSNLVAGYASRNVGEVSLALGLPALLSGRVLPALFHESNRKTISRAAGDFLAEQAGAALDDEVLREVSGIFESHVPEAADAAVRWLRTPETRAALSERGRELLPRILEKLSDVQKFFITAGQFDRRLNEKMPEIIDETILAVEAMLRDPVQQKRIVGLFLDSASNWRDSLLATDPAPQLKDSRKKLSEPAARILSRLLARLDDPHSREIIGQRAGVRLQKDRRTLGAFFRDVLGVQDSQIVEAISSLVLSFLTRPESAREIAQRLCALLVSSAKEHPDATVGSTLGFDGERKRRLDASLRARVPRAAQRLAPVIMPAVGEALASSRRFGSLVGLFGAATGLVVGLLVMFLRLID